MCTLCNFTSVKKAVHSVHLLGYVNFNYCGLDCIYKIKSSDIITGKKGG